MKNERDVKKKITATVKSLAPAAWYCTPIGTGYGRQGIPDILICLNGRLIAVECKFGNKKPTALQVQELRALGHAGAQAVVVNDESVEDFCNQLVKEGAR